MLYESSVNPSSPIFWIQIILVNFPDQTRPIIKKINAESTLITLPYFTIFYKNKVVCVVWLWQWSLQRWWWQFKLRVFWSMMMAMQWWYSWSREWGLWLRVVLSTELPGRASFKSWRSRSVQTGRPATAKRRRMPGYQWIREAVQNPGHKPHVFTLMKHSL